MLSLSTQAVRKCARPKSITFGLRRSSTTTFSGLRSFQCGIFQCESEDRSLTEELGTPLADIFSNLADQMRLRKSQWAEAVAGKAQIKIHGPQLIIMVACMLTILAPFIFEGISSYL